MTKREARKVVDALLRARLAGDVEGMLSHFAPTFSFGFPGATPPSSLARQSTNQEQLRAQLKDIVQEWRWKAYDVVDFIYGSDRAAVVVRHHLSHAVTGTAGTAEVVDIVRFENGKVVELREFTDTAQAAKIAGRP